jgi:hypothetical protein
MARSLSSLGFLGNGFNNVLCFHVHNVLSCLLSNNLCSTDHSLAMTVQFKAKQLRYVRRPVFQSFFISSPRLRSKNLHLLLSDSYGFVDVGHASDKRMGLSSTVAAGSHQSSHPRVLVPPDSVPLLSQTKGRPHSGRSGPS